MTRRRIRIGRIEWALLGIFVPPVVVAYGATGGFDGLFFCLPLAWTIGAGCAWQRRSGVAS